MKMRTPVNKKKNGNNIQNALLKFQGLNANFI